jgi:hypothetical protein
MTPQADSGPVKEFQSLVLPVSQQSQYLLFLYVVASISRTLLCPAYIIRNCRQSQTKFESVWKKSSALSAAWLMGWIFPSVMVPIYTLHNTCFKGILYLPGMWWCTAKG